MSRGMWEAMEAGARKVRVGKAEGRRGKEGSREEKEKRKIRKKEKTMEVKKIAEE